jgi:hypothetical protein
VNAPRTRSGRTPPAPAPPRYPATRSGSDPPEQPGAPRCPDRLPVPSEAELDLYDGAHELDAGLLARFRAGATGHPIGTFREAASPTDPAATTLPRTYIRATADAQVPIGPPTPGWDSTEIQTGHWPMFTRPQELADLLERATATSS